MNYTWKLKDIPDPIAIQTIQNQLHIDPALATLLVQRGIDDYEKAQRYFCPNLSETHDPYLMLNMEKAVERMNQAIANNEKVIIYGDYDVDGTTAVSLFLNVIRKYYKNVAFYIPDRFSEGYGLNAAAVQQFATDDVSLLFTLDCGIRSVEETLVAKSLGIDIIVCDHHEPGEIIPDGIILNPKQKDCPYPYKELSGCGVTFKFLQALIEKNQWDFQDLVSNIDLLTLSIAADIVPITGENRVFCAYGMEQINRRESTVIDLMFQHAKRSYPVQLSDIVFSIAPRINAAGRIEHAKKIVELFTNNDLHEIEEQINEINILNSERRTLDKEITVEAIHDLLEGNDTQYSNVVYREDWAKGVIGIVASRLVENNYRPSIVLTKSNGMLTGSGRSIPQINLFNVLSNCEHLLEKFGGHAFACGLSLKEENLTAFKQCFEEELAKEFKDKDCSPILEIDLEIDFTNIYSSNEIDLKKAPKFVRVLNQMEPFGPDNMRPVFVTKNVAISDYKILKGEHLRFDFQQKGTPIRIEAIAFNFIQEFEKLELSKPVDIVYAIGINRWNGQEKVQLEIRAIRQ